MKELCRMEKTLLIKSAEKIGKVSRDAINEYNDKMEMYLSMV